MAEQNFPDEAHFPIESERENHEKQITATVALAKFVAGRYPQTDNMQNMTVEVANGAHVKLALPPEIRPQPQLNY